MTVSLADARSLGKPASGVDQAANKHLIADLSADSISRMTSEEMIVAIRAAGLPFPHRDDSRRLEFFSRDTLQRLLFLCRHCCRNRQHPEHPEHPDT